MIFTTVYKTYLLTNAKISGKGTCDPNFQKYVDWPRIDVNTAVRLSSKITHPQVLFHKADLNFQIV